MNVLIHSLNCRAIRWLDHDFPVREKFLIALFKCIRFGLLVPWMLIEFKKYPEELNHIFGRKEILELVDEAISYITIKNYRNGNPKEIKFKYLNPKEQNERQIIRDSLWLDSTSSTNINQNYDNFKKYLQNIKTCEFVHWQSLTSIE